MPTLGDAFEEYLESNPNRAERTVNLYRQNLRVNLSDWINRPLSAISRRDVERRFHRITDKHGWAGANQRCPAGSIHANRRPLRGSRKGPV